MSVGTTVSIASTGRGIQGGSGAEPRSNRPSTVTPVTNAFLEVSAEVRQQGLLNRAGWFYLRVAGALAVGLLGAGAEVVLLGDRSWQLLIAAVMGILLTQVSFLAHEAGHRQVLQTGPANDRLARLLAAGAVGSYTWWDSKHSRHHGNPNQIGKDPDIEMYMGASFAPNHKGMPIIDPGTRLDFFSKQVRTSRNISGGWWATSLMAGSTTKWNTTFSRTCPAPTSDGRDSSSASVATGSMCPTPTSRWQSYASAIAHLNRVGLAARDPFECPMQELCAAAEQSETPVGSFVI